MEMMWFEWKKIFERRLNVISMLLGYVLIGVCVFSYITMASFYDEETDSYLKGLEAIRAHQEWAKGQPGVISEEYAAQVIEQIQGYGMDLESDEAYAKIIRPMGHIVYFLANNYTDMQEQMVDRNVLMEIDSAKDAGFYQRRMDKIRDYLNMDFSYGNYTEGEKEYWIKKAENIVTPFAWGDKCIMDMVSAPCLLPNMSRGLLFCCSPPDMAKTGLYTRKSQCPCFLRWDICLWGLAWRLG